MRYFLVLAALIVYLSGVAAAQLVPTADGTVTMDIYPSKVELRPAEARTVTAWVNATIHCENGYSPTTSVTLGPDRRSLEDDDGEPIWIVEPSSLVFDFQQSGNRFEARHVINFTIRAEEQARPSAGSIRFEVTWRGSSTPSNDCGMFGMSWRMEGEPRIDVTLLAANETWSDQGFVESNRATHPEASRVLVEGGPVRGESRIPGEAFWSLGIVFGLFASTAVYSFRKR